ncbi:unnamed protein product [Prorocentrum cordatum]|uniref:Alpha,alpha-trehalase n=1 Tax=Prorocentrum cordatum TaxID=2364126 RepID=A0ABN9QNK1_9DINO|nr:unnamed protein product [Polarella glacialis]
MPPPSARARTARCGSLARAAAAAAAVAAGAAGAPEGSCSAEDLAEDVSPVSLLQRARAGAARLAGGGEAGAAGPRPRSRRRGRRGAVTEELLQGAARAVEAEAKRVHGALKHVGNLRGLDGHALASMWFQAFTYTAHSALSLFQSDGTVFVSTGDIKQMWLRDSSFRREPLRRVLEGAMLRQVRFILSDPYASAFYSTHGSGLDAGPNKRSCPPSARCEECFCKTCAPECGDYTYQKDYELDSLLFPLMLHHRYWAETGSDAHLDAEFADALRVILSLLRTEQWHFSESKYSCKPLQGRFKEGIGLVWSFALPSDDQVLAGYNIPQNIMLVVALRKAAEMAKGPMRDVVLAAELEKRADDVDQAVRRYGVVPASGGDNIYAFQVDGWGNSTTMDDANMPNLLWLPYLGYEDPAGLYEATRRFVLSGENRNFFSGTSFTLDGERHKGLSGLGSRRASHGLRLGARGRECHDHCIWHLGVIMQGMTATSEEERRTCMEEILSTSCRTNKLHEGFSPTDTCAYNRDGFGWANALFSDWVLRDWLGPDASRVR